MNNEENNKLTTSEISSLWAAYMSNSMSICLYKYSINNVQDNDIKEIMKNALQISESIILDITPIFKDENIPLPIGFNDSDVNISAKPLFTDNFFLYYTHRMTGVGLNSYLVSLTTSSRLDIYNLLRSCIDKGMGLQKDCLELLKKKGLYIRPPYLSVTQEVGYVDEENYISSLLSAKRPLNYVEISHLNDNIQYLEIKVQLLLAFSQVSKNKDIAKYYYKVKEASVKHLKKLRSILEENDIAAPFTWESGITDSQESPFSEKLIMFQIDLLLAARVTHYGASAASSPRADIARVYIQFAGEIANLVKDGLELAINNNLFERPPQNVDRKQLIMK
jgi:hypothetical protein